MTKAKKIKSEPSRFVKFANEVILYKTKADGITFTINLKNKFCSCTYYLDKKICSHLIAASEIFNENIGIDNSQAEFFTAKNTRGRPKKSKKGQALNKNDKLQKLNY